MNKIDFRPLDADEIEVRVGGISEGKGGFLLLYKDARSDMKLLDETVGVFNWKRDHQVINDQLFCTVSIYDEDKSEWISKQDVGVESMSDAEKGRASDSFKRACTNWGIGRELYTAPFIWIKDDKANKNSWKYKKFRVADIEYQNNQITGLSIEEEINYKWQEVYSFGTMRGVSNGKTATQKQPKETAKKTPAQDKKATAKDQIAAMFELAKDLGISADSIKAYMQDNFKKDKTADLTNAEITNIYTWMSSVDKQVQEASERFV